MLELGDALAAAEVPEIQLMFALDFPEPNEDPVVEILQENPDAWQRDQGDVFKEYFKRSPIKNMMDAGTVPKGDEIPYEAQARPIDAFFD